MDRYQRLAGAGGGRDEAVGSVRRAREMMQAQPPNIPQTQIPQPQYSGLDSTRAYQQNPKVPRARQHLPAALSASRGGQPVGAAISRPTHVPQWPLAASVENIGDQRQQSNQNGPAPQRPPRPRNVPSMLDASKIQDHTPAFQYKAVGPSQQGDDDVMSPDAKSTSSHASRPSTISSVGSIPDFPVPDFPVPIPLPQQVPAGTQRRSVNLGPPSARRGASSYYSNASFVSPILEESPRTNRSHGSYASSAAIPSRWDDGTQHETYYEDSDEPFSPGSPSPEHNEESDLVRSASFGRKGKPTVVTMGKASEKPEPSTNVQSQTSSKLAKMGVFSLGTVAAVAAVAASGTASGTAKTPTADIAQSGKRDTAWPTVGDAFSPLASGTGFIDSSSSESVSKVAQKVTTDGTSSTIAPKAVDPRVSQILAATQAASRTSTTPPILDRTLTRLSAIRRPPKLDIDAVREAESRGSLTSLPDLIRRATKLAAMMEKGKRPASRLALNDFSNEDLPIEKETGRGGDRRSGLSGMLAAFPPPGLAGSPRSSPLRRDSTWPSPLGGAESQQALRPKDERRKQRRCCGLPVWVFVLILIFTMIIIAAAVVVPLELLVFHKAGSAQSVSALSACQASTTCDNGGTVVITSGVCACICSNGFTGSSCASGANASCSMVSVNSADSNDSTATMTYSNVTVGNAIPRLVSAAQANFSIPLVYETILAKLNAGGLSCDAENALVSFDGSSNRAAAAKSSTGNRNARRNSPADITTSDGAPMPSVLTASAIITTSSPAPTSTSRASATFTISQELLDFARTAVLYILQVQELSDAVTAQGNIQSFLSSTATDAESWANLAGNVTATDTAFLDFLDESITVNGTRVGGTTSTSTVDKRSTAERREAFFPVPTGVIVHTGWVVTLEGNKEDE